MMFTTNLEIRLLERQDIGFARTLHNAEDTLLYLSDVEHISEPQQEKWFESICLSPAARRYILIEKSTRDYVGVFRVDNLDWKNRSVCLGLDITSDKRGNRYSSEAYLYFLDYFFRQCGIARIYLATLESNQVARAIYRKLGFTEEGRSRSAIYRNGRYQDLVWMSILASEYGSNP